MNIIKRASILILALVLLFSTAACGAVKVNPEKDRERVVAEVGDKKILKGDFLDIYDQQKVYYGINEEAEKNPEYKDQIQQIKVMVLDSLITQDIWLDRAEKAGYAIDDKVKADTKKEIMDTIEENLKESDTENKENKNYEEEAKKELEEYLKLSGFTEDEFVTMVAEQNQKNKFMEETLKDVKATDEDIKKYYDDELKAQKEKPETAEGAIVQLFRPAGYIKVKHILIDLPSEEQDEYKKLIQEGKEEEAKKYLDEKLKGIEPKSKEVLDKAKSGENFEKLIEEYSADSMDIEEGYVINKDTSFIQSFKDAAFKLNEGEISGLVEGPYGYHIIKLYEKLPEKTFTLDETKDQIQETVDYNKKSEKWSSLLEEWEKDTKIKKYEKRL